MTGRLQDRVIVVTGGGQGIGRAVAHAVDAEGGIAVVADINFDAAKEVATELANAKAIAVDLDVADRRSWQSLVEMASGIASGTIHGLVNNAGITRDKTLLRMNDDEWRAVIDVNLTGSWLGCQLVIPAMKAAGGGAIVNLSSESRLGAFGQSNYSAAKAGVVGLTRTVALEHARHGVRCNAVAPGTIETPMVLAVPEEVRRSWLPSIPLGRIGAPEEVARAIVFLLSDDSSFITGHVLDVSGGAT